MEDRVVIVDQDRPASELRRKPFDGSREVGQEFILEPERVKALIELGIDAIITDKPDMAVKVRHASNR